jgi:hypothetical protein
VREGIAAAELLAGVVAHDVRGEERRDEVELAALHDVGKDAGGGGLIVVDRHGRSSSLGRADRARAVRRIIAAPERRDKCAAAGTFIRAGSARVPDWNQGARRVAGWRRQDERVLRPAWGGAPSVVQRS